MIEGGMFETYGIMHDVERVAANSSSSLTILKSGVIDSPIQFSTTDAAMLTEQWDDHGDLLQECLFPCLGLHWCWNIV